MYTTWLLDWTDSNLILIQFIIIILNNANLICGTAGMFTSGSKPVRINLLMYRPRSGKKLLICAFLQKSPSMILYKTGVSPCSPVCEVVLYRGHVSDLR